MHDHNNTLNDLKQLVDKLSWHDQLLLISYISKQLSNMTLISAEKKVSEEELQKQRDERAKELLAMCDTVAERWKGPLDSAEEIRRIREERDEQIWQSK